MRRITIDLRRVATAFAPDGFHGVAMADVGQIAGVAKPTLYRAYPSKEALFLACVQEEVERVVEQLYVAWARSLGEPLEGSLTALARALLAHAEEHPDSARLLWVTAPHTRSAVAEDVEAALQRPADRAAELVARHPEAPADPELVAVALLASATALVRRLDPPWDRDAAAARVGALLV